MLKIVFISGVKFGYGLLEHILEKNWKISAIISYAPELKKNYSDYADFDLLGEKYNVINKKVKKINDTENIEFLKKLNPDLILVMGWSQLLNNDIIKIPKIGIVGSHPTELPKFRGRAPIPWTIIKGLKNSALTFFYIEEGVDNGDIVDQQTFEVQNYDDATSLTNFFLTSNTPTQTNSTSSIPSTNSTSTPSTNSTSVNEQNNVTPQTESQNELKLSLNKENFKVGETITIRASLDRDVLEQNVAVSVIDPNNKNVVSRTITIENSDQSNLQFKLVDDSASGTYLVKITSLINGQTISDSTEFTVVSSNSGVKIVSIEPTDQQGNPVTEFTKNKMGFVKVVLSAENPINSLVTVNLFDSEFTSLGVGSFKTQLSGEHEIILSFFTPEFATIGNGEIYANVFSEWPSAGGIPLTGESSSQVILK